MPIFSPSLMGPIVEKYRVASHARLPRFAASADTLAASASFFVGFYESIGLRSGAPHFIQLVLEDDGRDDCCNGGSRSKQRGDPNKYNSYIVAFILLTALGFATCSIGVYCILYRRKALVLGVILQFGGSIAFLLSLGLLIGLVASHGA
jgi:hypothetical protein